MAEPQTPPLSASSHHSFYDSPFSDYHTDSSRSSNSTSSLAQKSLLRRLNLIGSMIQQSEPKSHLVRAMHLKLDALEATMAAPDPQSRLHLEDSGLFMEEEEPKTSEVGVDDDEHVEEVSEKQLANDQMTFDLDRIARNVEEHMDYMNQLLDEAKRREEELEEHIDEIRASKRDLRERFEEVKRNNTAALEHIGLQHREITSLKKVNRAMENHLVAVKELNGSLQHQSHKIDPLSALIQDPQDTRWKNSLPTIDGPSKDGDDHHVPSSDPSEPLPTSRWTAFWNALSDAAGIINYDELMKHTD